MTESSQPLGPGDRLGPLEIVQLLVQGGVSRIYEARSMETGDTVALKWHGGSHPGVQNRLKREHQHLTRVRHPNVVTVHHFDFDRQGVFFTMELIRGVAFDVWLHGPGYDPERQPRRDYAAIRHAFGQLARAVHAVHEVGLLHRDINPNHVLVADDGRVVLLGFSLACEQGPGAAPGEGVISSAPLTMAPEQMHAGLLGPPAAAADWYAVGVLLYEALTGRRPFELHGGTTALLAAKLDMEGPPYPSDLVDDVPVGLEVLCLGLLEPQPEARPTAAQVIARMG